MEKSNVMTVIDDNCMMEEWNDYEEILDSMTIEMMVEYWKLTNEQNNNAEIIMKENNVTDIMMIVVIMTNYWRKYAMMKWPIVLKESIYYCYWKKYW